MGRTCGEWWGVCVELYSGVSFKSAVPLVDIDALHERFEWHNKISVIPKDIGNTIGFVKELLSNGEPRKDKPQYFTSTSVLLSRNLSLFREVFRPFGVWATRNLSDILKSTSPIEISWCARKLRFALISKTFFKNPIGFLNRRLVHEFSRAERFIRPPGSVVVFLGVDGVGKSTVIQAILPTLKAATHNAVFLRHLRPGLLPPLARLKGRLQNPETPVVDPHQSTPSGPIGSLFRLAYLTLDYIVGYWLSVRPKIAKRPAVVIFDRYAYDMVLDPIRFRINIPARIIGWLAALAPKPDLIVCLYGSPEIIAARKHELPVEETKRQVAALRAFASRQPQAVLVSTDTSLEETRDQVLHAMGDALRARSEFLR